MPTVNVFRDYLNATLGEELTEDQVESLCFDYGLELDEVTSERQMQAKEKGDAAAANADDRIIYKIEVPANRYDLLCAEGLSMALNVFRKRMGPPKFKEVAPPNGKPQKMIVKAETSQIRPFVVSAVLRGIKFNQDTYQSFIDLQDKLHQNICRKRTLVAIGTHDLDTIQGPFTYEALPPSQIEFVALNQQKKMTAVQLMDHYQHDNHLKKYLHIIKDSPVFPVIYDAKRVVLSMPPIINGEHSKIKLSTRNVLIECTATDMTKARIVLNTMVAMFSQHCDHPFTYEKVEVTYENGSKAEHFPDMDTHTFQVPVDYIKRTVGVPSLDSSKIVDLLNKMMLEAELVGKNDMVSVVVPPTRSDIIHACDVAEDVAIAYGYNNIVDSLPATVTRGQQLPINKLSDQLRREIAQAGFMEVLTMALCSREENFGFLNQPDDNSAVTLSNPKTLEFQVCRTSLLPGLLKTLKENKQTALPLRLFEISDVILVDTKSDVGARNERRLAATYTNTTSGFEVIHGIVDRLMELLYVQNYKIENSSHPSFFPGRAADIYADGKLVGSFGVVHPDVLSKFEIAYPTSAVEINLESFL